VRPRRAECVITLAVADGRGEGREMERPELDGARLRLMAEADGTFERVERELHDGVLQRLTTSGLELELVRASLPDSHPARVELAGIAGQLREMAAQVRELSFRTFPAILTEAGLGPALRSLKRHASLPIELDLPTLRRIPALFEATAYQLVAEVARQAGSHLTVRAEECDDRLRLTLAAGGDIVLRPVLRDRLDALGAEVTVGAATVTVVFPVPLLLAEF